MQNNLPEQVNKPLSPQNPKKISQLSAPPYYPPNAQLFPVVQTQPYVAFPVNFVAKDFLAYNQSLKERLCCPRIWTWVIFCYYIFATILYICNNQYKQNNLLGIFIVIIIYLIVAIFVTQSSNTGDGSKYKLSLKVFTVYFIIKAISLVISLVVSLTSIEEFEKAYGIVITTLIIGIIIEIIIESTTLFILCKYKNVFDELQTPLNQQDIPPQQL